LLIVAVSADAVGLAAAEGPAVSVDELAGVTLVACGLVEVISIGGGVVAKAWFNEIGVSMVFHAPQSLVGRIGKTCSLAVKKEYAAQDCTTDL